MSITVHDIGSYIVKNYILETPAGLIAIDTGYPGGFPKFKALYLSCDAFVTEKKSRRLFGVEVKPQRFL